MSTLERPKDLDAAWNQVLGTKYTGPLPTQGTSIFDLPKLLSPTYLAPTLTHVGDTLPPGRKKLIHPVGTVAILRYVPRTADGKHMATGLLAEEQLVLARLSIADPTPDKPFAPGLALKFFPNKGGSFPGPSSRSVVAVVSLEGFTGPREFFRHALTTFVPKPTSIPFEMVNHQAQTTVDTVCPGANEDSLRYPLNNLCNIDRSGTRIATTVAPEWIEFWPTGDARKLFFDRNAQDEDFRTRLAKFPVGTHVFRVWGAPKGSKTAHLPVGELFINESPIACAYGDETLFFQHQYKSVT